MITRQDVTVLRDYFDNERASSLLPYHILRVPEGSTQDSVGRFSSIDHDLANFYHPKYIPTDPSISICWNWGHPMRGRI